jgi:hypothetical protein
MEWCNSFGCMAIAVLNSFFHVNMLKDEPEFDTDESCVEFVEDMLLNLKFLFSDTSSVNPKTCVASPQTSI